MRPPSGFIIITYWSYIAYEENLAIVDTYFPDVLNFCTATDAKVTGFQTSQPNFQAYKTKKWKTAASNTIAHTSKTVAYNRFFLYIVTNANKPICLACSV